MPLISPEIRTANETLLKCLTSNDSAVRKEAADMVSDYLRLKNREDGFARKILPPQTITSSNLDRQVDTPDPVVVIDMEAESAGAQSIPFGTGPMSVNIEAGRYAVFLRRIISQRYQSDVARLLTWNMDIRQMLKDFLLKDIQGTEDKGFMATVNRIVGSVNTKNTATDACGWVEAGPLDRVSFAHARKGLPSTNKRLNATIGLINNITIWDIPALDRVEIGGDLAEKLFLDGEAPGTVMGLNLIVTIKNDLVGDHELYQFADPKYTGNFLVLEDIILSTENINYFIEFFGYEMVGAAIRNVAAVCKTSFTGAAHDWRTGQALGDSSSSN